MLSYFSCVQLFSARLQPARLLCPWGFSRQEYWSVLPCPPPGDLPHSGTEPMSLMFPALAGRFLTTSANWELLEKCCCWCCCWVASVGFNSVRPHRWQPTRLPSPWDSPGKNTGVVCHFLLSITQSKIMTSGPTVSWEMEVEKTETETDYLFWLKIHCRWWWQL